MIYSSLNGEPGSEFARYKGAADIRAMTAGRFTSYWDGRDHAGHPVAGGIYSVEMRAGDEQFLRKVLLR